MKAKVKAVVFDIYNTLFHNEEPLWIQTFEKVCAVQRLSVDPLHLWRHWRSLEVRFREERTNLECPEKSPPFRSYREVWTHCFRRTFEELGLSGDPEAACMMLIEDSIKREPFPETLPVLSRIDRRWKKAILSNADDVFLLPLLERYALSFDVVLSSEMARAYKPLPRLFYQVLEKLQCRPEEGLYVGDHPYDDIQGAKSAGLTAVWVNRQGLPFPQGLIPPDYTIPDLWGLLDILARQR